MTSISKNVYLDKLDDIVNKYNNAYHSKIKMKPVDAKWNIYTYILTLEKKINDEDPKFKICDILRLPNYNNNFAKSYVPSWSEEVFVAAIAKSTFPWTYVISYLTGKKIVGTFYEKEFQKTNQKDFGVKKVIKRYGDKLYVKWKGYDNCFNSWIDKKEIV